MTKNTTTNDDNTNEKIAGQINNMHMMDARRHTLFGWLVTDWRNDEPLAYFVDLNDKICECGKQSVNDADNVVCEHILLANHKSTGTDAAEAMQYDLQRQITELRDSVDGLGAGGGVSHSESASETTDADASEDETQASNDTGERVTEADPSDEEQMLVDDVQSWLVESAGVVGFDPEIIQTDWVETPDGPGVRIEASPFQAGYWDDGDWQDQEAFEDEKETLKESVLKARDEVVWFGEPDYANVVLEGDVDEVTG